MIGKTHIGGSFRGCVEYQFKKLEQGRGAVLLSRGVRDYTAAAMTQDFEQQRRLNPSLGRAVWHTSIAFSPEEQEQVTDAKMISIAQDYLTGMGLAKGQYVVIRHDDRAHPHFHIVANRVADDGTTVSDSLNYSRSEKLLRELEQKYELQPTVSYGVRRNLEQVPAHEQVRIRLRELVQACARPATSWSEFTQAVTARGVTIQLRRNASGQPTGISFEQAGQPFKGSQLARTLSLGELSNTLALNRTRGQAQVVTPPARPVDRGLGY